MPKIIVFVHQKGGVGKSTLSINMAHSLKEYSETAIIDFDRQGSVTDMKDFLSGLKVMDYSSKIRGDEGSFILVDTPPYISDLLIQALAMADLILIPTQDGILDIVACRRTVQVVKETLAKNPHIKAGIVLNMVKNGSSLTNDAQKALEGYKLPVLHSRITHREDFKRSVAIADGIYSDTLRKSGVKARQDLNSLVKEVLIMLQ